MIKQPLTPERINRVQFSLQKLAILSYVILFENQAELDVNFRIPYINNFAKRIGSDCQAIQDHIGKSGRMVMSVHDNESLEEYSSEIWRVVTLLAGIDVSLIREFADNLEKEFKDIGV
jgi:hypothetical protein